MHTAVAFLVFNRPELTSRVLGAISEARPPRLLVVADGPREGHPTDAARCAQVRAVIEAGVDWPCRLEKNYSEKNLGCGLRVASGLDWVFEREEEAIILEDDCLPDPTFFRFCEELLERYRADSGIALIAGCNFQPPGILRGGGGSYYFSRYFHCWGWASWRRAWQAHDHEMRAWRDGSAARWLAERPWPAAEQKWWQQAFTDTAAGRIDTWDFPFALPWMMAGGLGIVAQPNLVSNIGFGAEATHTGGRAPEWATRPRGEMYFPLLHPAEKRADREADAVTGRQQFSQRGLVQRILVGLRRRAEASWLTWRRQ